MMDLLRIAMAVVTCPAVLSLSERPHIITVLIDDLGWNDVGFHGSNQIKTPNMDALAYSGIILNRHYVLPSCTPSRSALLTGFYPIRTGLQGYPLRGGENRNLPLTVKLKPEFLKDLGYRTHMIGKWHLGYETPRNVPNRRGFDSFFGYYNGYIDYYKFGYNQSLGNENGDYFYGYDLHMNDGVYRPDGKIYATRLFTKRAESVIESHNASEPLYLYLSHLATHTGDDEIGMEVPEDVDSNAAYPHIRDSGRRAFAGCLEELDESIGSVMEALNKKGILENSIVLVMSDNGGHTVSTDMPPNWSSNWPLAGTKFTMFEGGIRGVALVWSPLLPKGIISEEFFHVTDWLPTFYSAAGGDLNRLGPIDGRNQWETLKDLSTNRRDQILINVDERTNSEGVIIENRWKVIKGGQPNYGNYDYHWGREENIEPNPEYDFDSILTSKTGKIIRSLEDRGSLLNRGRMESSRRKSTVDCRPPENNEIPVRDGLVEHSNQFRCPKFCVFDIIEDPCELNPIENDEIVKMAETILAEQKKRMIRQTETRVDPKSNPKNFDGVWMPWNREGDQRANSSAIDFVATYLNPSIFLTLSLYLFRRI